MFKYIILFLLLSTPVFATDIYCPKCYKHLYTTEYDIKQAIEEKWKMPAKGFHPQLGVDLPEEGTPFICPIDGSDLNGYIYWFT